MELPEGSLLQIVSYGFQLPGGETLEGVGVTPDVIIEEDWLGYSEAEDPFMLAALEALALDVADDPVDAEDAEEADGAEETDSAG